MQEIAQIISWTREEPILQSVAENAIYFQAPSS